MLALVYIDILGHCVDYVVLLFLNCGYACAMLHLCFSLYG